MHGHFHRAVLECKIMAKPIKIKNKNGSTSYRIFISNMITGKRESKTFSTRALANQWADKRLKELEHEQLYGKQDDYLIKDIIQQYQKQFSDNYGRSKNYDIARLLHDDISQLYISQLNAKAIIAHCLERSKEVKPQTVKNDVIWLRTIMKTMSAVLDFEAPVLAFEQASEVLYKEKLIGSSKERTRRPTRSELWRLSRFFYRGRAKIPMLHIMWFAIYSARRLSEITRLEWADNNPDRLTGLVRDAKHPRNKKGNHKRFKYTRSGWKIVCKQKPNKVYIFPYNERSISANFTRACKILGIDDLHFHDLRHEAASRLFEAGYPIEQVQLFTLHESWKTLARYTHLKPEEISLK